MRSRALSLLASLALASWLQHALASGASAETCQDERIAVTLGAPEYEVEGTLCWSGALAGKTVQLLLHGITSSRVYWDFPLEPERYSYVKKAVAAGYAVLNLDRVGSAESDRPPAIDVNLDTNTLVAHQVVDALRRGSVGNEAFERVIAVGHSFGSLIAIHLAGRYPRDVEGVILTGMTHDLNPLVLEKAARGFYPAELDPKFAGEDIPPGYLTTRPGIRREVLFAEQNADAAVIALEETLKDTVTIPEFVDFGEFFDSDSLAIEVPALLTVGELDLEFCGFRVDCSSAATVTQHEKAFFDPKACLEVFVLPQAGHFTSLHLNAPLIHDRMVEWADEHVGTDDDHPPSSACPSGSPQ